MLMRGIFCLPRLPFCSIINIIANETDRLKAAAYSLLIL
jgi:hypothetical protein